MTLQRSDHLLISKSQEPPNRVLARFGRGYVSSASPFMTGIVTERTNTLLHDNNNNMLAVIIPSPSISVLGWWWLCALAVAGRLPWSTKLTNRSVECKDRLMPLYRFLNSFVGRMWRSRLQMDMLKPHGYVSFPLAATKRLMRILPTRVYSDLLLGWSCPYAYLRAAAPHRSSSSPS